MAFDGRKQRPVTRSEYDAIVAKAAEYDLFIDMTNAGKRGLYRARRRLLDGKHEEVWLTTVQARVLAEVMLAGRPLLFRQMTTETTRTQKAFEEARRMVDVSLGRRSWRAFQVLKADTEYEKGVTFSAGSLISMWLFWPG